MRVRGGGKLTSYKFNAAEFEAMDATLPDEVATALRVSAVNFPPQHDGYSWFSKTPGEVSRQLNEIVDLSAIDTAQAHVAKQLRSTRTEVDTTKARLADAAADVNLPQRWTLSYRPSRRCR